MSPAEKQAREEMADRKMNAATDAAYTKSLTTTEYAPEKKDPRDAVRGQKGYAEGGNVSTKKEKMVFNDDREPGSAGGSRGTEKSAPGGDDVLGSYKRGGKVSSASKRGDGIATKGKTRGTMITMKGGGYAC